MFYIYIAVFMQIGCTGPYYNETQQSHRVMQVFTSVFKVISAITLLYVILDGRTLSEPMKEYCSLDPKKQTSVKS